MNNQRLPNLSGTTLAGAPVQLPRDLPVEPVVLVVGFTHGARHDVGAWKTALTARGVAFLSLPTAATDVDPLHLVEVVRAMRAHVPRAAWERIIQIHEGGAALRQTFGWEADVFAKLLLVNRAGEVLARHDSGPFDELALAAFLG